MCELPCPHAAFNRVIWFDLVVFVGEVTCRRDEEYGFSTAGMYEQQRDSETARQRVAVVVVVVVFMIVS